MAKQQLEARIAEIEARAENAEKEKTEIQSLLTTEEAKCKVHAQQVIS